MARARLTITGLGALNRKLGALEPKLAKKVVRTALREGAKVLKAEVERNAPVGETGQLKANVKVQAGPRSRKRISIDVTIGKGDFTGEQFYAMMVEHGTSKQPPQGYMRRAFDTKGDYVKRFVVAGIKEGIDRENRSA